MVSVVVNGFAMNKIKGSIRAAIAEIKLVIPTKFNLFFRRNTTGDNP